MNVHCVHSVQSVPADQWQALEGTGQPLLSHAWLGALEQSGSVGDAAGWSPHHLLVRDGETMLGAMPLYAKSHSFGEFVYDWAWADLAQRCRLPYYPKLVSTSPLTPATGARLLVRRELAPDEADAVRRRLLRGAWDLAQQTGASGVHLLFVNDTDLAAAVAEGYFARTSWQYHWQNDGFGSPEDFLLRLDSKRRRNIRRERRVLAEQGYRVVPVPGRDLTTADIDDLFRYYALTCRAYRTRAYVKRAFFDLIVAASPDVVLAFFAVDGAGRRVAGTFNVVGEGCLWGRYWGADEHVPLLHFETCLYALIDHAIRLGIERIEPGAGGEHKYTRGFAPVPTLSAHRLVSPRLHGVLEQLTLQERDHVERIVAELDERGPLRPASPTGSSDRGRR